MLSSIHSELLALRAQVSSLQAALEAKTVSAPAKMEKAAKKPKKERDPEAPKRPANAWILFTKRVRDLLKENGYTKEAVGIEANMFSSTLKDENADLASWSDEDILARRADWTRPAVSKWVSVHGVKPKTGSVVSGEDAEDGAASAEKPKKARKNPWEGLSEEAKAERIAKMKAGKAAKKAAAEDDGCGASGAEVPAETLAALDAALGASPFAEPKKAKKTEPALKKAETPASPKPSAAASASAVASAGGGGAAAASASASGGEFRAVLLGGKKYLVNQTTGHSYHRLADGGQGEWAGMFVKTPKPHIDDSVPEPTPEAEEEDELNFDEE
jgi:hypothetical protein